MNLSLIIDNLLTPPILFFALGMLAALVKSDLEIPQPIARFMSLYLLFAIGLHGGVELAASDLSLRIVLTLIVATLTAAAFPLVTYYILKRRLGPADAAAIAATYGSISAVTFVTAAAFLTSQGMAYGGHMVAAMALMESPAIVVGVMLYRRSRRGENGGEPIVWSELFKEAALNGAVLVLMGSLIIGMVTGPEAWASLKPMAYDPFKGVLCLFLLDMGLVAAKRLNHLGQQAGFLMAFALVAAVAQGLVGVALARALGLDVGDALLLAILCGSASYIAVPAAMRLAIPSANPSLYVPLALGITFPFNIALGIPLYLMLIERLW